MNNNIKRIHTNEFYETEYLTWETFWSLCNPGCSEHLILHNFRRNDTCIKEPDLVVSLNSKIIGRTISIKAKVVNSNSSVYGILYVGLFFIHQFAKNTGQQLIEFEKQFPAKEKGVKKINIHL